MRHFVFHLPILISEAAPDSDAGGAITVKDVGRQHLDVHVYDESVEEATAVFVDKLQILLGDEEPEPATLPSPPPPYVGPV